jgi:hypothetical protein
MDLGLQVSRAPLIVQAHIAAFISDVRNVFKAIFDVGILDIEIHFVNDLFSNIFLQTTH